MLGYGMYLTNAMYGSIPIPIVKLILAERLPSNPRDWKVKSPRSPRQLPSKTTQKNEPALPSEAQVKVIEILY